MHANEADILLNTWQVEDAPSSADRCQGDIRIIEGITLDPEPTLGEAQAPVLLGVRGRILKIVALASPLQVPCGQAMGQNDLREP